MLYKCAPLLGQVGFSSDVALVGSAQGFYQLLGAGVHTATAETPERLILNAGTRQPGSTVGARRSPGSGTVPELQDPKVATIASRWDCPSLVDTVSTKLRRGRRDPVDWQVIADERACLSPSTKRSEVSGRYQAFLPANPA